MTACSSTSGVVAVDGHVFYLVPGAEVPETWSTATVTGDLVVARGGEVMIRTGLATSWSMPLVVETHEREPVTHAADFEDIAETSIIVNDGELHVLESVVRPVFPNLTPAGPGTYRVRVHAHGREHEYGGSNHTPVAERYLLQIWPAPHAADAVVRLGPQVRRRLAARRTHIA